MINGVDMLVISFCFVVLFVVWHIGGKYNDWLAWDRERRHQRMRDRIAFYERQEEEEYRERLKLFLPVWVMIYAMMGIKSAAERANETLKNFHLRLSGSGDHIIW